MSILDLAIKRKRSIISAPSEHVIDIERTESLGAFSYAGPENQDLSDREIEYKPAPKNWLAPAVPDHLLELSIKAYNKDMKHFRIVFHVVNVIGLGLASIITYICVKWLDGFSLHPDRAKLADYNVHLVCTVVGLVLAPAYGMLIFRIFPHVVFSRLVLCHVVVLMLMSFLASFGVKIAYDSHHVYGPKHLYSLHSWVGVTITVLLFFLIISGTWLYFSEEDLAYMKYFHRTAGVVLFGLSAAASISGILTRSRHLLMKRKEDEPMPMRVAVLNTLGLGLTLFSVLVRYLLSEYQFRRRPRPGSEDVQLKESMVPQTATIKKSGQNRGQGQDGQRDKTLNGSSSKLRSRSGDLERTHDPGTNKKSNSSEVISDKLPHI